MPIKSPKQFGMKVKGLGGPTKKEGYMHEGPHEDKSKFAKALNKKKKGFSY